MLTIFTNPRPFLGPFDIIQKNAIKSWIELRPKCEIILFEDEENTSCKAAKELDIKCISNVECDEWGTPLLSDVFGKVQNIAKNEIIAQVNADIILMSDFLRAIILVKEIIKGKDFFMTGRRWNLDITKPIQFEKTDWEEKLRERIVKEGRLHGLSGMDYWIFPQSFQFNPPPFVVGRPGMDSWLIYKARSLKIPVIDATKVVTILHQNHNYSLKRNPFFDIERKRNLKLAGGFSKLCTLRDADWILTQEGFKRPEFPRRIFSILTLFYPWRILLLIKRKLQRFLK